MEDSGITSDSVLQIFEIYPTDQKQIILQEVTVMSQKNAKTLRKPRF